MRRTRFIVTISVSVVLALATRGAPDPMPTISGEPVDPAFTLPGQGPPVPPAYPLAAFSALGCSLSQAGRLAELGWNEEQISAFVEGVRGALHGKTVPFDEASRRLQQEIGRQVAEIQAREKRQIVEAFAQPGRVEQYMKEARKRYGLQASDSGLEFSIQGGRPGIRPGPADTVVVSCIATAADGATRLPQLSSGRVRVKVADLLPGFMEGIQMMSVDSRAMFILPPALSFGAGEWPQGVDRGTPLIFFVTLHEVLATEAAP